MTEENTIQDNLNNQNLSGGDDELNAGAQNVNTQTQADEQENTSQKEEGKTQTQEENKKDEKTDVSDLFNAPENYDYKEVQLPENMKLDEDLIQKFNPIAKKLNLSQKGANEIMALAVELVQKRNEDYHKFAQHALDVKIAQYEDLLINDKEIGGNKLDETLKVANVAYEAFVPDDVKEIFANSGLNKHPSMVKMFLQFGKLCQEDRFTSGNTSTKEERPADILFPSTSLKQSIV